MATDLEQQKNAGWLLAAATRAHASGDYRAALALVADAAAVLGQLAVAQVRGSRKVAR